MNGEQTEGRTIRPLRTLAEIRTGNVTITVEAPENRVEVEHHITGSRSTVEILTNRVEELERLLAEARQIGAEYDRDRIAEKDRADQNRSWAERAESRADQASKDLDNARRRVKELERVLAREVDRADRLEATLHAVRKIDNRRGEILTEVEKILNRENNETLFDLRMKIRYALRVLAYR